MAHELVVHVVEEAQRLPLDSACHLAGLVLELFHGRMTARSNSDSHLRLYRFIDSAWVTRLKLLHLALISLCTRHAVLTVLRCTGDFRDHRW